MPPQQSPKQELTNATIVKLVLPMVATAVTTAGGMLALAHQTIRPAWLAEADAASTSKIREVLSDVNGRMAEDRTRQSAEHQQIRNEVSEVRRILLGDGKQK